MQLEEIILLAKKQDRKAQTALYHQFKSGWFMICLRYCSNRADASDALQNALILIFSKIEQFDAVQGEFKSWSSKIVVNSCLMFLRKNTNRFQFNELKEDILMYEEQHTQDDVLSVEEMTKMIQELPIGYRTVFNLYVLEGYTHVEIAEILEISIGTSKSQLSKSRKLLKQKLEVVL